MNAFRKFLKRIRPVEALYVSMRVTPTVRDGLTYACYRLLVWLVDRLRFSRRLSVAGGGVTRRMHLTFALRRPNGPPAILTLPVQPQTYWTLVEVFHHECYRPRLPLAPQVIVDAGANIGLSAAFLHGLFPSAHVICVEPDPTNLPLLRRNLSQNGVPHTIIEAALGRSEGRAEFRVHKAASEYSATGPTSFPDAEYRRVSVAVTTLSAVLATAKVERVGLLKIDIEGGEFDVLDGMDPVLRRLDYITGEFHGFAGDLGRLADRTCRASGLSLLERAGTADLATFHFGSAEASAGQPPESTAS